MADVSFTRILQNYSSFDCYQGSDKLIVHSYGSIYENVIGKLKNKTATDPLCILEIGIMTGAFLQALSEYLPEAEIYGVDITMQKVRFGSRNPKIHFHTMDGTTESTAKYLNHFYDLIIDDASHLPSHQKTTLDVFAPYLKPDGIYIIEDINIDVDPSLETELRIIGEKHGLVMQWNDIRNSKGRTDDVVAIFTRRQVVSIGQCGS